MIDIDRELDELAGHLIWPVETDLTARISSNLPRERRPALRAVAMAAAVLVAIVLAVPAVRDEVAAFLGIGGVTIERGVLLDPATEIELGPLVAVDTIHDPLPEALGTPSAAYRDDEGRLWVVYEPFGTEPGALLTIFQSAYDPGLTKLVADPSIQAELVEVAGSPAYWVSGDDHVLLFETPDGSIVEDRGRLAAPTLIWQRDELTYRLESDLPMDRAVAIAESTR